MELRAFHNKASIKKQYVSRLMAHYKADEIVKGHYWEKGKGCAVGCTIHSSQHNKFETELGLPEWLARLEDNIFENLPNDKAKEFPLKLLKAIRVGVNLEKVKYKFCAYLCKENIARVKKLDISEEIKIKVLDAITKVKKLHDTASKTGKWDNEAAQSAAWSAESAAASAARSAASAARSAESAAASAAASAASAAWSAAWSAAASAAASAESAAWSAAYVKYSEVLIKLLKEAK